MDVSTGVAVSVGVSVRLSVFVVVGGRVECRRRGVALVTVGAFVLVFVTVFASVFDPFPVSVSFSVLPLVAPGSPIQPAVAPRSASVALCRIVRRVVFESVIGIVHNNIERH